MDTRGRYSILHGNRHDASAEPGCHTNRIRQAVTGQKHFHHLFIIVCSYPNPYGAGNIHNIIAFGGMQYDLSEQEWNQATASFPQPGLFPVCQEAFKGTSTWTFLPGTFQEIQAISKLESAVVHVVAYSGAEAVEEQIKALGPQNPPDILHIATHGFLFLRIMEKNLMSWTDPDCCSAVPMPPGQESLHTDMKMVS